MDNTSVIAIEVYQQNLEAVYGEQLTSMATSLNKFTDTIYPICAEYVDDQLQLQLQKGAIVFISEDKSEDKEHDFQQTEMFENKMFEILRMECPGEINNWLQFSDEFAAQFRSSKVKAKLLNARKEFNLQQV